MSPALSSPLLTQPFPYPLAHSSSRYKPTTVTPSTSRSTSYIPCSTLLPPPTTPLLPHPTLSLPPPAQMTPSSPFTSPKNALSLQGNDPLSLVNAPASAGAISTWPAPSGKLTNVAHRTSKSISNLTTHTPALPLVPSRNTPLPSHLPTSHSLFPRTPPLPLPPLLPPNHTALHRPHQQLIKRQAAQRSATLLATGTQSGDPGPGTPQSEAAAAQPRPPRNENSNNSTPDSSTPPTAPAPHGP